MNLLKKHIPNIHSLQSFVCAAKHSSFTQAAIELHLTQSAISRQIKDLESQLGVTLFKVSRLDHITCLVLIRQFKQTYIIYYLYLER